MNNENIKTNESNKLCYCFTDNRNFKNRSKNIALVNLSIHYTWKNIKSACNNIKFKKSDPTQNDEFDLLNGSYPVSDTQDYFEYIIKKHDTVADIPSIQIYINRIKNRVAFKIKTGCKLELLHSKSCC